MQPDITTFTLYYITSNIFVQDCIPYSPNHKCFTMNSFNKYSIIGFWRIFEYSNTIFDTYSAIHFKGNQYVEYIKITLNA